MALSVTIAAVMLLLVVAVIAVLQIRRRSLRAQASAGLRRRMLHLAPAEIGLSPAPGEPWGIVMDMTHAQGSASVISIVDGSASLYFSRGGGVIGGQDAASAARSFVELATTFLSKLGPPPDESLPQPGYTRFFVLTTEAKRFAEAPEEALRSGKHDLSPLYYAGLNVINELRLISKAGKRP